MSDRTSNEQGQPLTEEERRRAGDPSIADGDLSERELQLRNFGRRLTDWTPDNITIIRNGVPISGPGLAREIELGRVTAPVVPPTTPVPAPVPTVVDIDEDGNLRMSDGTIRVPKP